MKIAMNIVTLDRINWPLWRLILTGLNFIAIILSLILSWHYFKGGTMVGCGSGSACDQVLSSRWSSIAGIIPVSGLALGAYLAILIASLNIGLSTELSIRRLAWSIMLMIGGAIIGSAIWFTILQKWIIGEFCIFCMSAHVTGLILSLLILWRIVRESNTAKGAYAVIKPIRILGLVISGLVVAGVMATFQLNAASAAVVQNNEQPTVHIETDYRNAPIVGSPDAPYIVTILFDYMCSHCQKIHFMLAEAARQYDGKLAFVLCPTPLENSCNPYIPVNNTMFKNSCELARTGLAVWRANPEVFPEFENWMFTFESGNNWRPRSPEAAMAKAAELVGQEKLDASLADPWITEYIQGGAHLFGQTRLNGRGGIPKMIYNGVWVIPEPYNADDLVMILQKSLGVPKP
jgi:uncharacterized membrane protein